MTDATPARSAAARKAGVAAAAASLALLACAPTWHRAPAYRYDAEAAHALEARAWRTCEARGLPGGAPTRPFRTDGCSMWPDAWITGTPWQACCVEHDIAYWCGGPPALRREADHALRRCVGEAFHPAMGGLMLPGVVVGGHPWVPLYFRWGYGRGYPAPYYGLPEEADAAEAPDADAGRP